MPGREMRRPLFDRGLFPSYPQCADPVSLSHSPSFATVQHIVSYCIDTYHINTIQYNTLNVTIIGQRDSAGGLSSTHPLS